MLSVPQGERLALTGTLDDVPEVPASAALESAVRGRADIRAIGEHNEMAQRAVSLAMAELKPVVAFTGNFQ